MQINELCLVKKCYLQIIRWKIISMYEEDLALNTLQVLICYKIQTNQTKILQNVWRFKNNFSLKSGKCSGPS